MKKYFLIVALLCLSKFAHAQNARDIIEKYITARGGIEKLDSIKSIFYKGTQDYYGQNEKLKITIEKDKLRRFDIKYDGQKGYWMVSKNTGGQYFPWENKTPVKFPDTTLSKMQGNFDIPGELVHYKLRGETPKLLGVDSVNKNACYKILLNDENSLNKTTGTVTKTYWIDTATYLLLKIDITYFVRKKNGEIVPANEATILGDYRLVDGILFDYTESSQTFIDGKSVGTKSSVFDKIELNKPVTPESYELNPL